MLIIPVTNLYKPISDLCVDWLEMGVADKRTSPHQYLLRISLCEVLVRFRTKKHF